MKRRIWTTAAVGLAAARGGRRRSSRDGRVHVAEARGDDRRERVSSSRRRSARTTIRRRACAIFVPAGTQLTTTQAPGTVLGPVRAIVKALDLAGADLPLEGQLVVAAPGQISAASQAACIGATSRSRPGSWC